ncbi:tetratricopeptide repeat protein [Nostoc sphaeroides CHAB 2801]|uniref:tetratricopeptide repeat protein n=1 Tax=Nostoc sphaeroides TaxID=446679 RepID=UPI000E4C89D4|nr:tetratricopeptide repeat protein [Nostoc sphaeroides]MCC5628053.1 tetratricopeptide repeat protein [Nostoc sphaeroides CHAB 2801]
MFSKKFKRSKYSTVFFKLGNSLFVQGKYQEAIAQYQKFLKIQSGDADIYCNL